MLIETADSIVPDTTGAVSTYYPDGYSPAVPALTSSLNPVTPTSVIATGNSGPAAIGVAQPHITTPTPVAIPAQSTTGGSGPGGYEPGKRRNPNLGIAGNAVPSGAIVRAPGTWTGGTPYSPPGGLPVGAGTLPPTVAYYTIAGNFIAGQTLVAHSFVKMQSDGKIYYADFGVPTDASIVLGMTAAAAITGGAVVVVEMGSVTDSTWSLTPGQPLYLAATGQFTQVVPFDGYILPVGLATGATSALVRIGTVVERNEAFTSTFYWSKNPAAIPGENTDYVGNAPYFYLNPAAAIGESGSR